MLPPCHAIIVVQLGAQATGLIVELVSDIVTVEDETLQSPPTIGENQGIARFLDGIAPIEDRMVMILNCAALTDVGQTVAAA
ncbi:hypothetical protein AQZ52_05345 [Novosphingobium fuchskuhlense]|uniref:CheW-like domain-containing protein n=1 Tax=Novosphingobium fuchskuhlense TaxID=1117702 RepID=A0A124JVV4_9SPHN|nr:chemotaxis protein CheW [Novosphingobium fuchskuhlense]KUR72664.1 hypothetical protein AQZ52_05345 [Novosphingobium fuchskuhlense]